MSRVLTRRTVLPAAAAPVVPRPGCTAEPVRIGLVAAPYGWSATSIARGVLARPERLLADHRAVRSGGRVPRTRPAPAMLSGLHDGCLGGAAA